MNNKKILKDLAEQAAEKFVAVVDVEIHQSEKELEGNRVEIPFTIDLEYRDWGLKDIYVTLSEIVDVSYLDFGEGKTKEVKVDLGKLKIKWVKGSYSPYKLYLELSEGNVNYDRSYLEFGYVSME